MLGAVVGSCAAWFGVANGAEPPDAWMCMAWRGAEGDGLICESIFVRDGVARIDREMLDTDARSWTDRTRDRLFILEVNWWLHTSYGGETRLPAGLRWIADPAGPDYFEWADGALASAGGSVANCSMRTTVGPGRDAIVGFVVRDAPTRVLMRAVGPGLRAFGVDDAVANPLVRLYRGDVCVFENDDWGLGSYDTEEIRYVRRRVAETGRTESDDPLRFWSADMLRASPESEAVTRRAERATGAFALESDSLDAALVVDLAPGVYTLVVASEETGTVLGEVYPVSRSP